MATSSHGIVCLSKSGGNWLTSSVPPVAPIREENADPARVKIDQPGAAIVPRCAAQSESGLELVRAESQLRRHPNTQQDGDGDQAAAAGDGIDEARREAREKQQRIEPERKVRGVHGWLR